LFSYRIYSKYPLSVNGSGPTFSDGFVGSNYYIPINGNRDNQPSATEMVENINYDSEPDIFTANFLEHSIKFMRNPQSSQIIVLNKEGYNITRTGDNYKIVTPSGTEFYFDKNTTVESSSVTTGGLGGSGSSSLQPSSR